MADKKINRELSIYINDRQVINSLGGVTREITKVNAEMRNLNKNSASYDTDLKKLQGTLSELKDKQAEFKDEIQATNVTAGQAS
jgi:predicted nuclease with TOPRIM domain